MTIDLAKLTATLPESAIEWRVQQAGEKNGKVWAIVVPYADARYLLDVLDAACGPQNWRDEYAPGPNGGVLCRLSIRFDGEWVAKEDAADNTDIEGVKGGITDAFKRACVKWNVAGIRALYNVGDALFATVVEDGRFQGQTKQGTRFRWNPPRLNLSSSSPAGSSGAAGSAPRGQQRPQGERVASARRGTAADAREAKLRKALRKVATLDAVGRARALRATEDAGALHLDDLDVLTVFCVGQDNIDAGRVPDAGMTPDEVALWERAVSLVEDWQEATP